MNVQALSPLFGAAITIVTCYAAGVLLIARLRPSLRRAEKIPLAFVLGAACLHMAIFVIFAMKIAYKPVLLALAGGVITAALIKRNPAVESEGAQEKFSWKDNLPAIGYAAIFAIFTILYFVIAWAPEVSSDGSGYHLGLIAHYLRARGFVRITTNMYAGLGEGAELLYALAFAFGRHSAAALVHFSFAVALAWSMLAYGLRIGKWWVGAGAALLVYVSPVVGKDATSAYVDLAAAAITFSVFYWLEIWEESRNDRLLVAIGLLAGYAYATKYTAVVILPYALAVIVWRKRSLAESIARPLIVIGAAAAAMMLPWMIKDWLNLRDPIAPFGVAIFRNANAHVLTIFEWTEFLRNYDMPNKWRLPLELTIRGGVVQGLLGPVFLAAPLALIALRFRAGRRLLLAGCVVLIPYFGNIGTRFLIPCLPFFAIAMTLAVGDWPRIVAALVLFQSIASWPAMLPSYADATAWRIDQWPLDAALRRQSEDRFLRRNLDGYLNARMVEEHVPHGERVLLLNAVHVPEAYTTRDVLVGFQGAFNEILTDAVNTAAIDGIRPKIAMVFQFPERMIRHIRVVQTADLGPHQQWSVHEIRYLRKGSELPRSSAWRLRAWPNPWDVQLAFDNSPATRWRTWEIPKPNMYIETDFGRDEVLDEVRIETSPDDQFTVKLQMEAMDQQGRWTKIAENPEVRENPVPPWLRRSATHELQARGVNYLIANDSDYGAADFLDDPDAWGFKIVARDHDVTLYRVVP